MTIMYRNMRKLETLLDEISVRRTENFVSSVNTRLPHHVLNLRETYPQTKEIKQKNVFLSFKIILYKL